MKLHLLELAHRFVTESSSETAGVVSHYQREEHKTPAFRNLTPCILHRFSQKSIGGQFLVRILARLDSMWGSFRENSSDLLRKFLKIPDLTTQ